MKPQTIHCHTTLCDGRGTPAEMAAAALAAGCSAIGFSGHAPLPFPSDWCMEPDVVADYRRQVLALREAYQGRMDVFLGLEQDYFSPDLPGPWDYRIGSLHCLERSGSYLSVDESPQALARMAEDWFGGDYYALARAYYALEADVVRRTGCQVVGHFDLVTKFNEEGVLFDEGDRRYRSAALEALETLLDTGAVLEVNTGAMSRGYRTAPYPAAFLLRRIRERGGSIVITSDSHSPSTLLYGYREASELARACGFTSSLYLTAQGFAEGPLPF